MLPVLLTGGLLLLHRTSRRLRRPGSAPPAANQLLLLSFIAILSHPFLDGLNTYGVRWLMPFSGTWYYGDTLFIIDPWLWITLAAGVIATRGRDLSNDPRGSRLARLALAGVALYIAVMALSGRAARASIEREVGALSAKPAVTAMAGPVPINPFVRRFVVEQESEYQVGTFSWLEQPHLRRDDLLTYPRGRPPHPAFLKAAETLPARRFLGWARFPTFEVQQTGPAEYLVHMVDLRYARRPGDGFGTLSVPVTLP